MGNRDIVARGTSAGGLPLEFPAAILVTLHLPREHRSSLDMILSRAGPLSARFAMGKPSRRDTSKSYIAPPARHLLFDGNELALGTGPTENNARSAVDPMLRSVAVCGGSRSIGVALTGTLGDGVAGLWALKQCGRTALVQDPSDAVHAGMPEAALRH